jgi:hypothetical protein
VKIADDIIRAMGGRIAHCTAKSNLTGILEHGLMSAEALALHSTNREPHDILLREQRVNLFLPTGKTARLNHQKPILHGRAAAGRMLDGHTPESWAAQLDTRIFFWPEHNGKDFAASIGRDFETTTIWLDTRLFLATYFEAVDLCPINSGNFLQGGANTARGDWIYSPASLGFPHFANNRLMRGQAKKRDRLKEISLRVPVAPDILQRLIVPSP